MPKIAQKQIKSLNMRQECAIHFASYFFHLQAPDVIVSSGSMWVLTCISVGIRLFDRCPPPNSCGTEGAMWSDVPGPDRVGEVQLIKVFVSDNVGGCKSATYNLGIIRCSNADHDFIYRHEGDATCNRGYCGTL